MTRASDYVEGGQLEGKPRRLGLLIACCPGCAHLADGTLVSTSKNSSASTSERSRSPK